MKEKPLFFNNESVVVDQRYLVLSRFSNAVLTPNLSCNPLNKSEFLTCQTDYQIEKFIKEWKGKQKQLIANMPSTAVLFGGFSI
ncbi:hypothetical protein [Acinetobacter calcoaceticus]